MKIFVIVLALCGYYSATNVYAGSCTGFEIGDANMDYGSARMDCPGTPNARCDCSGMLSRHVGLSTCPWDADQWCSDEHSSEAAWDNANFACKPGHVIIIYCVGNTDYAPCDLANCGGTCYSRYGKTVLDVKKYWECTAPRYTSGQ